MSEISISIRDSENIDLIVATEDSPLVVVHICNHQNLLLLPSHVSHGCDAVRLSRFPLFLHRFVILGPGPGPGCFLHTSWGKLIQCDGQTATSRETAHWESLAACGSLQWEPLTPRDKH